MCTVSAKPKSTGYGSRYKSFLVRCPSSHSRKKCLQREDRGSAIPCFKPARLHPCELVPNPLGQPWERTWHMQRLLRQALCFPGLTREPASQSMDTVVLQVREIKGLHIIIDRHRRRTEMAFLDPCCNDLLAEAVLFNLPATSKTTLVFRTTVN